MKNIKNDYCIRMFVGNDPLRPAMTNVSLQNGYLYSTNASIAAKINADLCVQNYTAVEKYPNVEKVFSEHESIEKKTVSVDTLFKDMMKIECCFKPKMIDCKECGGDGTVICPYCDSEHDCKECGGTGKMASDELVLSGEHDCILFGKKYNIQFLDLILRTAVYTNVSEVTISNAEGTKGTVFYVGDFIILLVPKYQG